MTSEDILRLLHPWREQNKRSAWKPETTDGETSVSAAKFAGRPWLADDESWPTCELCDSAMPLFLQLDLAQLPAPLESLFGSGLLQLFYCTSCDEGWEPFSSAQLVRIVQPNGEGQLPPLAADSFPAKTITGWIALDDLPNPQEHAQLGVEYHYHVEPPSYTRVVCRALDVAADVPDDSALAERVGTAAVGDKLAGWPHWIQGVEYPRCPRCQQVMSYVFQIDSEDHIPFMFGDVGIGHIMQCPTHKEVVAFGWACS